MKTTPIRAHDTIEVQAPLEQVWRVLSDIGTYPSWWPSEVRVRVLREVEPVGTVLEIKPRGGRPFCRRTELTRCKMRRSDSDSSDSDSSKRTSTSGHGVARALANRG